MALMMKRIMIHRNHHVACLLVVLVAAAAAGTVVRAWRVVPSNIIGSTFQQKHCPIELTTTTTTTTTVLQAAGGKNNDDNGGGYKFGDITRSLGRKITGDKNYQFGDISKKLDQTAKAKVNQLTGRTEYKFGDLSRWADSQVKEKVANYTGKANYKVGDITKEIVRRVRAGDYKLEDVVLMLRVLLQMGVSLTPVGRLLPIKVLLEILNVGLAQDVGGRVMGGVASSLDERFKEAITGDANYKLGDKTKEKLSQTLTKLTGKDSYSFGDISQFVATRIVAPEEDEHGGGGSSSSSSSSSSKKKTKSTSSKESKGSNNVDSSIDTDALVELLNNKALEEWDRRLLESKTSEKDTNQTRNK